MAPAKIFQLRSLLNGLLNYRAQPGMAEAVSNLVPHPDGGEIKYASSPSVLNQGIQEESLIEIGPRLDIQAGIDLLASYKNVLQPVKTIRIDLQGAQTIHGAVIQSLLVIQKSCETSGRLFIVGGLTVELSAFFQLAGLNGLLVENQAVEML